jgi:AbrB family looped-hinge helix DNA binding protein
MKSLTSTITSKGQLVIPVKLRRKHGFRKGTRVAFIEDGTRLVLQPVTPEYVRSLRGILKRKPSALRFLLKERKRERAL